MSHRKQDFITEGLKKKKKIRSTKPVDIDLGFTFHGETAGRLRVIKCGSSYISTVFQKLVLSERRRGGASRTFCVMNGGSVTISENYGKAVLEQS